MGTVNTDPEAAVNTKPGKVAELFSYLLFLSRPPAVVKAIALIGSGIMMGEAVAETNRQVTMVR